MRNKKDYIDGTRVMVSILKETLRQHPYSKWYYKFLPDINLALSEMNCCLSYWNAVNGGGVRSRLATYSGMMDMYKKSSREKCIRALWECMNHSEEYLFTFERSFQGFNFWSKVTQTMRENFKG